MEDSISSSSSSTDDKKIITSSQKNEESIKIKDNININKNINSRINLKFCYKKIGYTFCFFSDEMGNPLIMIGPNWPMFIFLCGGLTTAYIFILIFFIKKLHLIITIYGIATFLVFIISYTATFLLNNGYPERNENSLIGKPRKKFLYCRLCEIWVKNDKNVKHCWECGVCVEGYDHHCPWTGKCIGRKTLIYFYCFVCSVFFIFLFFICVMIDLNLQI